LFPYDIIMSITNEQLYENYYILVKAYIEDNGEIFDAEQFQLKQKENGPFISSWKYDTNQPTYDDLKEKNLDKILGEQEIKNKIKNLLTLTPLTKIERDTISPQTGCLIFNSDSNKVQVYNGTGWTDL
jgi:hypothetical protein